ncbi:MAG: 50S ribosomal protein L23 [Alphaproteobacteria bacterium]|nr:50S ribosomal protein L23 [Alphaproteobacteria bacterium]
MSKKKATAKADVKAFHYDVLQAPVITEKSTMASEHGKVVFRIGRNATKPQVKEAVEALFNVDVIGVNTALIKGKTKVFRGRKGVRSDYKKAVVTLKEGQSIDYAAGV